MPFVKCNGINLYYEIHGKGTELLFLNGLSGDINQRKTFLDVAEKHFKIIIPDLRGSGFSDKPKESYSIDIFADDIIDLLKELSINKINIMGYSMGGYAALNLANKHPNLVEKLILVSTKPAWTKPSEISEHAKSLFYSTTVSTKLLTNIFDLIYGPNYKKEVTAKEYVNKRMSDQNPQPAHAYLNQLKSCEQFDMFDQIKNITTPTLVITGKEDKLISPENSYYISRNIKNSEFIEYEGVGHVPPDECPEKLTNDIARFLKI